MLKIEISEKIIGNRNYSNINLNLEQKVYILKGENGIGKTTLLNMIYNVDHNYKGEITYNGIKYVTDEEQKVFRETICTYVTQEHDFLNISALDNIKLLANGFNQKKLEQLVEKLDFQDQLNKNVKSLSGGEIKKLQIIIGLLKNTPLLLMDEVENHLDQDAIKALYEILKTSDQLIIIISHKKEKQLDFDELIMKENSFEVIKQESKVRKFLKLSKTNQLYPMNIRKCYQKNLIVLILGMCLCSIALLVTTNFNQNTNYELKALQVGSFGKTSSIVIPPALQTNRFQQIQAGNYKKWNEKTPGYFTDDFVNKLKKSPYVTKVEPIMPPMNESSVPVYLDPEKTQALNYDPDLVNQSIDLEKLNYKKYGMEKYKTGGIAINTLQPLSQSAKQINKIPDSLFNIYNVKKMMFGAYPQDNSEEILIDPLTAVYYAEQLNLNKLEDLIGKDVTIKTDKNDGTGKTFGKKYRVSGIYEPKNIIEEMMEGTSGESKQAMLTGYASYSDKNETVVSNDFVLANENFPKETRAAEEMLLKQKYEESRLEYHPDYYKDGINYYPGLYVEVKNEKDVEKLTKAIREYDENIEINNNYVQKELNDKINGKNNGLLIKISYILYVIFIMILIKIFTSKMEKIKKIIRFNGVISSRQEKIMTTVKKDHQRALNITGLCLIVILMISNIFKFNLFATLMIIISFIVIQVTLKKIGNHEKN